MHDDGATDISWGARASLDTTPSYDPATGECANVYCHGATLEADRVGGASDRSPTWTRLDGTQAACDIACHTSPPGGIHPTDTACENCHALVMTSFNVADPALSGWANRMLHINGILEMGLPCGNGVIGPGETCDPPATCPTSCSDGNACTADTLVGQADQCNVSCTFPLIVSCIDGDGCCPSGCTSNSDDDCSQSCGNNAVEPGETCDPPASCPTSCSDGNGCTTDTMTGSAANCNVACGHSTITTCTNGDGCCPPACNANNDSNCAAQCNNGTVEPGETCDPPASCPTNCNDGNPCTSDSSTGSAAQCTLACVHTTITACVGGDGCCPSGCTAANDSNCTASCGNSVIEPGETCDPPASCPTSCADTNPCTVDQMTGSSGNCNVACSHTAITACANGDGCCPTGCNSGNDNNCSASCGNTVIDPGETCDPPASCPTSCADTNPCTVDQMTGSPANCNVVCSHTNITTCTNNDGCCAPGCNANTDNNCTPQCGNSVIETGETCDPQASCPTSCADTNPCTTDQMSGSSSTCNVSCTHTNITTCVAGDGCCPPGCNANNDGNCTPQCGNGVVESGETCDPQGNCPTSCVDGNNCTVDQMTGSSSTCNVACSHTPIVSCANNDNCCPPGCNNNNDNNCSASCGNYVIEGGETCDPPSSCPSSCADTDPCTIDQSTGSPANCNVVCSHPAITQCIWGDGCCPLGCEGDLMDDDCPGCIVCHAANGESAEEIFDTDWHWEAFWRWLEIDWIPDEWTFDGRVSDCLGCHERHEPRVPSRRGIPDWATFDDRVSPAWDDRTERALRR